MTADTPCPLNECICLEERIEAGVVELNALPPIRGFGKES